MDATVFIEDYREAFGAKASLPLVFRYTDRPASETAKINGCLFKALRTAREGQPVSLNAANIGCGGGKLYTGFSPMSEHVPRFVSEKERYKQTPQMVTEYIGRLELEPAPKRFLDFVRIDQAGSLDEAEGVLFFATPDMLSGLCAWAFYDNNAPDAVASWFGSGCSSVVSVAVRENRLKGNRTFLGLLDPSVRPYVGANELSFVIPLHRFRTMCGTMRASCLFNGVAWQKVRKRMERTSEADRSFLTGK